MAISKAEHQRRYKERHPERVKASAKKYLKSEKGRARNKYSQHKSNAKRRGHDWLFTFDTWWAMWEPHFHKRGQTSESMHMCRTNDEGPYSPENCRIDTAESNGREGHYTKLRRQQ